MSDDRQPADDRSGSGANPISEIDGPADVEVTRTVTVDERHRRASESEPVPPPELLAGRYRIERRLGSGGFGQVYLATDSLSGNKVAVKLLGPRASEDLAQFRRETGLLRMLRLPGVVQFIDDGMHDGRPFIVTEFVDGRPFPGRLVPSWESIEETAVALLEALDRVHAHGVIHRDLKPHNVLVTGDGRPMILDFGVSLPPPTQVPRRREVSLGTPFYMAPEQLHARTATVRSDLYSVGLMFYELVGERPPFYVDSETQLLMRKAEPLPPLEPRVSTPRKVVDLITALTAPTPAARPRSAADAIAMLGHGGVAPRRLGRLDLDGRSVTVTDLEGLFHGPEIGFHLPSDGARVLHRRTAGDPARLADEIGAWIRAGLCFWDGDRLRITRDAIERLDAGLEVVRPRASTTLLGRRLAAAVQRTQATAAPPRRRPSSERRPPLSADAHSDAVTLDRVLHERAGSVSDGECDAPDPAADTPVEAPSERARIDAALDEAADARRRGRCGIARRLADGALTMTRALEDGASEERALVETTKVAIDTQTIEAIDLALWEVGRATGRTELVVGLELLLRAARRVRFGDTVERRLEAARAVPRFDDVELERLRHAQLFQAAAGGDIETYEAVGRDALDWARSTGDEALVAAVHGWVGFVHYHKGDFDACAAECAIGADGADTVMARINAMSNVASALIEARRLDDAAGVARTAVETAEQLRRPFFELRLRGLLEDIQYRMGTATHVDEEAIEAVRLAAAPAELGIRLLTQAAIAWRIRDERRARELALESAGHFGAVDVAPGVALAHALACAAGDYVTPRAVDEWMARAAGGPAGVLRQAAALFACGGVYWSGTPPAWTTPRPDLRAEVLSPVEADAYLAVSRDEPETEDPDPASSIGA